MLKLSGSAADAAWRSFAVNFFWQGLVGGLAALGHTLAHWAWRWWKPDAGTHPMLIFPKLELPLLVTGCTGAVAACAGLISQASGSGSVPAAAAGWTLFVLYPLGFTLVVWYILWETIFSGHSVFLVRAKLLPQTEFEWALEKLRTACSAKMPTPPGLPGAGGPDKAQRPPGDASSSPGHERSARLPAEKKPGAPLDAGGGKPAVTGSEDKGKGQKPPAPVGSLRTDIQPGGVWVDVRSGKAAKWLERFQVRGRIEGLSIVCSCIAVLREDDMLYERVVVQLSA